MSATPFAPAHCIASSGRLAIPKEVATQLGWLQGKDSLQAWLWLVSEGRYRLLTIDQIKSDPLIFAIWEVLANGFNGEQPHPSEAQPDVDAATVARLIPLTISPPGPQWRIVIPNAIEAFTPDGCDPNHFSMLLTPDGFWEIWHTNILRRSASQRLPALL